MIKKILPWLSLFMAAVYVQPSYGVLAVKETLSHGDWKIMMYEDDAKVHDWSFRVTQGDINLFTLSRPQVNYDNENGVECLVNSSSFAEYKVDDSAVNDDLGTGRCITFTFSKPENGDDIKMVQRFYLYDGHDYLITDLSITGSEKIRSNYLAPVSTGSSYFILGAVDGRENFRMLKVPFDNDGFSCYTKYPLNRTTTSYEVGAVVNGNNGSGVVMGSVDHDHWKSAVRMNAEKNNGSMQVCVYSGASDIKGHPSESETRDVIPHGKIPGPTVSSARMFIGFFDDWRDGMEQFADLNTEIATRLYDWEYGTPVGWQSWGVLAEKNSYEANVEIRDYYQEVLKSAGFVNSKGYQVIGLDASDGHSAEQHKMFCRDCSANNQIVGCYGTPFSLWWGANDFPRADNDYTEYNGKKYPTNDLVIKAGGKHVFFDNAWCRDPTHPITKKDILQWVNNIAADGFKYVKLDFVNCGIIQADSYYNKNVHTAVEAYCEGMKYFMAKAKEKGLFVSLSIAPLFPHQFAHSRRIACDTWGRIGWSSYCMNAISNGWWTDRLYQYNDPDGLVMVGAGDEFASTEGENRARVTSGVVSGMVLVADNFSPSDQSGRGSNELSRQRAEKMLMNREINKLADNGKSFRPVYGHKEYDGTSWISSENFFQYETGDYYYVAIFNFTKGGDMGNPTNNSPMKGTLPLEDLGFTTVDFTEVRELWMDEVITVGQSGLPYNVPSADARVFRFTKSNSSGIVDAGAEEKTGKAAFVALPGEVMVYADRNMSGVKVYDMQGKLLNEICLNDRLQVAISVSEEKGVVLVKVRYADGTEETGKVGLR
ncbi:alpha-galactosidase [Paraprevotella xylaniphila]|uniref:alpha-galactosidase n=1 Tax=Paraprevotella xylaniphila TaxID=454155 RepID=UPI0026DBCF56|nr:hypothetical protein [Paraprevotella xylaniphila]